ncbi:MAG: MBL fold metallo-hydrolase [bacterium]|nr:MBL fold metallo-hydrolase [bacterium]
MPKRPQSFPAPAKTQGFLKVTDGIHAYIGGNGGTNFGLVLTNDKPVIIDNDIRARKPFLAGMRRITRKNIGLVLNTHHNFDHTSDNAYYHGRGAISFGCELIRSEMERERDAGIWVKQMVGRGPRVDHLVGKLDISPPHVSFEEMITIRYGGRTFQLIYIDHCHTLGDSIVWMPDEKVLFAGDILTYRTHPVARLGNFTNWIEALRVLKKIPARHIVPGHGPLPPKGSGIVDETLGYLTKLRSRCQAALRKEGSPVKAAAQVRMDEYQKWFRAPIVKESALRMSRELRKLQGKQ